MKHLWNDRVVIVRSSVFSGPKNDLGQDTRGTEEINAKGFFTYRRSDHSEDISYDGKAVLFLPSGTPIDDYDQVRFEGLVWRVVGPPVTYRSPYDGARYMQANLERTAGK